MPLSQHRSSLLRNDVFLRLSLWTPLRGKDATAIDCGHRFGEVKMGAGTNAYANGAIISKATSLPPISLKVMMMMFLKKVGHRKKKCSNEEKPFHEVSGLSSKAGPSVRV